MPAQFVFQRQGIPVFHEVVEPSLATLQTHQDELERQEPTEVSRRFWKDPVVVIGAAVPTLILAVFFSYLAWPHMRAYWKPKPDPRRIVVQQSIRTLVDQFVRESPVFNRDYQGGYVEASAVPADPRKVPGLWKAWAMVDRKPSPGKTADDLATSWHLHFLCQFEPRRRSREIPEVRHSRSSPIRKA